MTPKLIREQLLALLNKHRTHVQNSPGVGVDLQRYAIAVIDDIDMELRTLAAEPVGGEDLALDLAISAQDNAIRKQLAALALLERIFYYGYRGPMCDPSQRVTQAEVKAALLQTPRQPDSAEGGCQHDWKIWPETDGLEQHCMICDKYRNTPTRTTDEGMGGYIRCDCSCPNGLKHLPEAHDTNCAEQPRAEGGVVLVPRRPTNEMLDAGNAERHSIEHGGGYCSEYSIYRAMISAAPQPEQYGDDTCKSCSATDTTARVGACMDGSSLRTEANTSLGSSSNWSPVNPFDIRTGSYCPACPSYLDPRSRIIASGARLVCEKCDAGSYGLVDDTKPQPEVHSADAESLARDGDIPIQRYTVRTEGKAWCRRAYLTPHPGGDLCKYADVAKAQFLLGLAASQPPQQADGVAVASVRFTDGDMDFEQLAPMVDGLLYQPPPKSPGVGDETFQVLRVHIDDLRRCVIVLRDYPQLSTVADEFEKAANELTAVLGGEK